MSRQNNSANIAVRATEPMHRVSSWNDINSIRRQMDDLLTGFMGYTPISRIISGENELDISPDLFETDAELVFVLPIPGVLPEDVSVEATADTLTIKGERKPVYQKEGAVQHRVSWWSTKQGTFHVNYNLPIEINPDKVEAHYRHGVLELHLPKAETVRPRTVQVNVGS